ncbi:MAG: Gfo/Idh/MocA family protein [Microbacter sp.]
MNNKMNALNDESKKIRWGIIGTGRIAHLFAEALQEVHNAELTAVASRTMDKAVTFAETFHIPKSYESYEALVNDPEIDVVYIATPHHLHEENTIMALNHRKHVLCEKPMGVNLKESTRMIETARAKNLFLMEALWSRFLPHIIKIKELVDQGEIGEIQLMTVFFSFRSPNGPQHRHFNIDLCGGSLLDIGIYNLFLSLYVLGEPKSMAAVAALSEQGVDQSLGVTFGYDHKALSVMYSSFMADSTAVAEIHGSKGKIVLDHRWFLPGDVRVIYHDGRTTTHHFEVKKSGYELEAQEVVNCILAQRTQSEKWSWDDSMRLMRTMDVIRQQTGIVYPGHDDVVSPEKVK